MGVLNVTPDSFSDGGDFLSPQKALRRAEEMMDQGADLIDIGGESSAPGSKEIPLEEEWSRLKEILPVLSEKKIPFSVDTWKGEIARRALDAGAKMINDVTGLRGDPDMGKVLAQFPHVFVCIMYSKDPSARTAVADFGEENIVKKISTFLGERIEFAEKQGIQRNRIVLDPGMGGFLSSDPEKSFEVLRKLPEFQKFNCPLLVGTSRKGFLRTVSDPGDPKNRMIASIVSSLIAVQNGAKIVRVHDVREMKEALRTLSACSSENLRIELKERG